MWLGDTPDCLVDRPHREVDAQLCPPGELAEDVDVAQHQRRLGENRTRISALGEDLEDSPCQPILPLCGLVRIRVGAHGDEVTAPLGR